MSTALFEGRVYVYGYDADDHVFHGFRCVDCQKTMWMVIPQVRKLDNSSW